MCAVICEQSDMKAAQTSIALEEEGAHNLLMSAYGNHMILSHEAANATGLLFTFSITLCSPLQLRDLDEVPCLLNRLRLVVP